MADDGRPVLRGQRPVIPVAALAAVVMLTGCGDLYPQQTGPASEAEPTGEAEPDYTPEPEPVEPTTPTVDTQQVAAQIEAQLPVQHGIGLSVSCPSYAEGLPSFNCSVGDPFGSPFSVRVEVDLASGTWTWSPL